MQSLSVSSESASLWSSKGSRSCECELPAGEYDATEAEVDALGEDATQGFNLSVSFTFGGLFSSSSEESETDAGTLSAQERNKRFRFWPIPSSSARAAFRCRSRSRLRSRPGLIGIPTLPFSL